MNTKTLKQYLKTTDKYIKILEDSGIASMQDLLRHLPRTYEDRRNISPLSLLAFDGSVEITKGKITKKSMIRTPTGKRLIEIHFIDEQENHGQIQALNNPYLLRSTNKDSWYYIIGKPVRDGVKITFWHPELIEAIDTGDLGGLVGCIYPVYSDLNGIKSNRFAKKIPLIFDEAIDSLNDEYPKNFYKKYDILPIKKMMQALHRPESIEESTMAKKTIFFKKLMRVQIQSLLQKKLYQDSYSQSNKEKVDRNIIKEFLSKLPFDLTKAQKKALKEIIENLHEEKPMLRLLQGDVGSGKTVVATAAARYTLKKRGGQSAFLAPIEVLAIQHHKTLAKILLPLGVRVELLTGATKASEKDRIKQALALGHIDIIVGTHAIIQDTVSFSNLRYAIIDEQHKFGVRQRGYLQRHGSPHLLQMTATPIPRSMALAFFGEFDVSVIDEMPAGRKPIHTKIISESEFIKLKPWIITKIDQGQKIFLITPLIEDSESEGFEHIKAATTHFEQLNQLYPEMKGKIGLLHGKIKSSEKENIMNKFKNGEFMMLVSTTVIEVGIDIPDATVMIIYNAERFGLSQLHQLRGRVGRSDLQSYCFLETPKKSGDTFQRLKHMESVNDGFKLSEIDLHYRGPGEFLGVKQAGESDIPLEVLTDTTLLLTIQEAAQDIINNYPNNVTLIVNEGALENIMV